MEQNEVILGVDTHLDRHVGAVISDTGRLLGTRSVSVNTAGYLDRLTWANSFGPLRRARVEGTGTYGAGQARVLRDHEIEVFEVNRPDRAMRRSRGKSDPTDAENAARAVLSGRAVIPRNSPVPSKLCTPSPLPDGVQSRQRPKRYQPAVRFARERSPEIRDRLLKAKAAEWVEGCVRLRSLGKTPMLQTLTTTLRLLAKRWLTLAEELKALDVMLDSLTSQHARRVRGRFGVGPQTAAVLVAVAGDNPERLKSEAALAALCGTSPLQAIRQDGPASFEQGRRSACK